MRFRGMSLAALLLASAACGTNGAKETPDKANTAAQRIAEIQPQQQVYAKMAAAEHGYAASFDAHGIPQMIFGLADHAAEPAATPQTAARGYLEKFSRAQGLSQGDLESAQLRFVRPLHGGGYLARFTQRVRGVEVYPATTTMLMRTNLSLVALTGNLQKASLLGGESRFELSYEEALAKALSTHLGQAIDAGAVIDLHQDSGDSHRFILREGSPVRLPMPAHVKQIYYGGDKGLVAAYSMEFYAGLATSSDSDAFRYILSAKDGSVLDRRDLTESDAFTYRVWANAGGDKRPDDGPMVDWSPHPTGNNDGSLPTLVPTGALVTIEGFNTNPSGQVDPWLDAAAVETRGNNVDAYSDYNAPDGFSNGDIRATLTAANTFDRQFDLAADPLVSNDQTMAAIVELFYTTNWLHDWYYDSGFDELAGNAQFDNFGRGGLSNDPLHGEAQDSVLAGARNNANMSTPSDGMSPRMQMYDWTGVETTQLTVTPPGTDLPNGTAAFGPSEFDVTAQVVLANDGSAAPTQGCGPLIGDIAGKIVIVDRGTCTFVIKTHNAQDAGAIGVILANNRAGGPPGMGGVDPSIVIGTLSVTQTDGIAIKTSLLSGSVTAHLYRHTGADRDGSLDHTVVAHEWGHYLHHRLADCGSPACRAMSEGWGDFNALSMIIHEADNIDGVYPLAVYATYTDTNAGYFGIRRVPYSVDFTKNALSYRHISDAEALPTTHPINPFGIPNSEVHDAGEVWTTMLWQVYNSLLHTTTNGGSGPSFDDMRRRMADYVVVSLQMTPLNATYLEARDAMLAAASTMHPEDMPVMSLAFAARGAGSCAVSPARDSTDFVGVVESFEVKPHMVFSNSTVLTDDARSCDRDGVLDAEERGNLSVTIANGGAVPMTGTHLTISSPTAGVQFPSGTSIDVGTVEPFSSTELLVDVKLDSIVPSQSLISVVVNVTADQSCEGSITSTVTTLVNYDESLGATTDTVEAHNTTWNKLGDVAEDVWSRSELGPTDHAWFGLDYGVSPSDTNLESPPLVVGDTLPFVIEFDHRYNFETDFSAPTYWDGGVLEITNDGGATWQDISLYVNPGYGGVLTDTSGNPLALRNAFVATNASWPMRDHLVLDLGSFFASQTVQFRFRIGTDANTGTFGWEIDNIAVSGIDNAPFYQVLDNQSVCPPLLIADAGPDQNVGAGAAVILDGTASRSETGLALTYSWTQVSGPAAALSAPDAAVTAIAAPSVEGGATLVYRLTVSDGTLTASDVVSITVAGIPPPVFVANAGADQTVDADGVVILDGSGSTASNGAALTYAWTQTGGPAVVLSNPSSAVTRFVAPELAADTTFTFQLVISDGAHSATDTVNVLVHAYVEPVLTAAAGADLTVAPGADVVLDGSGSHSSAGGALTFLWGQVSGPAVTLTGANREVLRFTAPAATADTVLSFQLTVSDGTRSASDTVDVTVHPGAAPTVTAVAGSDQTVDSGTVVLLDASDSRSSANLPLTYAWTQVSGASIDLSNANSVVAVFTAHGTDADATYTFRVTVSDGTQTATDEVDITVHAETVMPPPPSELIANAGPDSAVNVNQIAVLDGSQSKSTGGKAITYMWSQTAGTLVKLNNFAGPVATFTAPSLSLDEKLTFLLTVSDGTQMKTDTVDVVVHFAPRPATGDSGCGCTTAEGADRSARSSALAVFAFAGLALFFRRRARR